MSLDIGDPAPAFELPDTDGAVHRLDGGPATVVVFTCNHCPYALAWHDRLLDVARDYEARGVRLLAINPNDAVRYPRDSFEAMQERVRRDGGWPAPYLHDATQEVAAAYGARTTPDVFVVDADGRVAYRGAPDADYDDPGQGAAWLREALDAVLEGRRPARARTEPVGCSIKWRA
ncbi:MAG TPA: thioredoxin family protein [Solirubrobacteraceae bacterium]|nr:thioredoxin family protein [Solirubrobacteraceae bacterium]